MAQMTIPAEPSYRRKVYTGLKGVNFSADPSLVDSRHSPDALNMISDNGGNPVKRRGWESLIDIGKPIDNLWSFYIGGQRFFLVASDDEMFELKVTYDGELDWSTATYSTGTPVTVHPGKKLGQRVQTPEYDGFFVFDTDKYWVATNNNGDLDIQEAIPYCPTVVISREPAGGGGVYYQDINRLTRQWTEQFLSDNVATSFVVTTTVDTTQPWKFEYATLNGDKVEWVEDPTASVSGATFSITSPHAPLVVGQDNIKITYYAEGQSKAETILECTTGAHFSIGTSDQLFVSGNDNHNQEVYYSEIGDPTYFPENNKIYVGGASTRVMGFLNIGEYLAVVKEQSGNDSTIFLVYQTSIQSKTVTSGGTTTTTNEYTYAIKRATTGIGAISRYCFGVLNDEPMFLSSRGIYGLVSTSITSEKVVRNRSLFLDKKLTEEDGLENAIATVFNNYYVLIVNNKAYILDGRHKTADEKNNTTYAYEAYYWENVPATTVATFDKEFWFGTESGKICRFKNSGDTLDYSDDGEPIVARWTTPNDNDGYTEFLKTMTKKGSMCTVAPYEHSSVKVYIRADSNQKEYLGYLTVDIWSGFDNIDFERFSFDTREGPRDGFWRKKKKKYIRLQIILENDAVNEPFGVFEIVKTYILTRYAKKPSLIRPQEEES